MAVSCDAESLPIWRAIGDVDHVAGCIEGVGALVAACGDGAHAVRIWGAAEALREASDALRSPADRAAHDRELAVARLRGDETVWVAAWTEGRTRSVEQVAADVTADAPAATREERGPSDRARSIAPRPRPPGLSRPRPARTSHKRSWVARHQFDPIWRLPSVLGTG